MSRLMSCSLVVGQLWRRVLVAGKPASIASPASTRTASSLIPFGWTKKAGKAPAGKDLVGNGGQLEERPSTEQALQEMAEREREQEKFIPVTRRALIGKLLEEEGMLSRGEKQAMEALSTALDAHYSHKFYRILEETKLLYDALDPDKDTVRMKQLTRKELLDTEYWLLQKVEELLEKANFFEIPRHQLHMVLHDHDTEGIRVSFKASDYETLRIWTRGRIARKIPVFQKLKANVLGYVSSKYAQVGPDEFYTRVVVAVRSKADKTLHIKSFKEVPCTKLEHLLPDGKIKMSKFDKGFLASSVIVGAAAVSLRSLPVLSDWKVQWTWVGLGLAGLVASRAWIGYKNKRNHYLVNLATTLYYRTVANNRGVLTLLVDRAQDEEFKEALLAYVFLLSPANRRGVPGTQHTPHPPLYDTPTSLKTRIEEWLQKRFNVQGVSFDVSDALDKLDALGVLVRQSNDSLSVLGVEDTLSLLPKPRQTTSAAAAPMLPARDLDSADEQLDYDTSIEKHGWR